MNDSDWLLFLYQLPAKPSTQRVFVWRRLKACGALYLQHSACLVPNRRGLRQTLMELKGEIESRRGEAVVLALRLTDPKERDEVILRFQAQSDEDYREFLGKCRDFHQELDHERRAKHFSFAELEENDVEIAKLRGWLPKIIDRDFFTASLAANARQALEACEQDFGRFSQQVAHAQGQDTQPAGRKARNKSIRPSPRHIDRGRAEG
jgi:hypothetical protein